MKKGKKVIPECGSFPIAILVAFGAKMMEENGGEEQFLTFFEHWTQSDEFQWLHKCKNQPQHDITHVYVTIGGKVRYRLIYGGYRTGKQGCIKASGQADTVDGPRILLVGPFERAPREILRRGFQGFRYLGEHLWPINS